MGARNRHASAKQHKPTNKHHRPKGHQLLDYVLITSLAKHIEQAAVSRWVTWPERAQDIAQILRASLEGVKSGCLEPIKIVPYGPPPTQCPVGYCLVNGMCDSQCPTAYSLSHPRKGNRPKRRGPSARV